eukprot:Gb_28272 [translate_table: standard]
MAPKINLEWTEEVNNSIGELRGDMELRMGKLEDQMVGFITKMENLMGKRIEHPRQVSSVRAYTLEHQKLATRVDGLDDEKMLELYIGGLKDEIRHELQILGLLDISTAIIMAKQIEAKNKVVRGTTGTANMEREKTMNTQGTFSMNLEKLFIKFKLEGKVYNLQGTTAPPPTQVISSHRMEKMKKGATTIIARYYSIERHEVQGLVTPELQEVLPQQSEDDIMTDAHSKKEEGFTLGPPFKWCEVPPVIVDFNLGAGTGRGNSQSNDSRAFGGGRNGDKE